jgi:hypothetical protein
MDRESMVKELHAMALARKEMHRLMTDPALPRVDMTDELRRKLATTGYNRFFPVFAPIGRVSSKLHSATSSYADAVQGDIRRVRALRWSNRPFDPIKRRMDATAAAAQNVMDGIKNRRSRALGIACIKGGGWVRPVGLNDHVTVSPMWLKNVRDEGIAVAIGGSRKWLVLRATRKPSAFLSADGISAWDVVAYAPDGTRSVENGFVLKADGTDKHIVFCTDFLRGANIIKKAVSNAVLAEMGA